MAVDERSRHELYERLVQALGPEAAVTMMGVPRRDAGALTTQTRTIIFAMAGSLVTISAFAVGRAPRLSAIQPAAMLRSA